MADLKDPIHPEKGRLPGFRIIKSKLKVRSLCRCQFWKNTDCRNSFIIFVKMGARIYKKEIQKKQFLPKLRNISGREVGVGRGRQSLRFIDKLSLPPKYKCFIRFYSKDSLFNLFQSAGSQTVQVPATHPSSTVF